MIEKIIIAGSRNICKYRAFYEFCKFVSDSPDLLPNALYILVTGRCPTGPDQVPFMLRELDPKISVECYPAQWDLYGKSAGPRRNALMAQEADILVLIWDGKSKGSKNMKLNMELLEKPVYEIIID